MSRLSPEAQDLVQAGRDALRPTAADRERLMLALAPHVGAALAGEGATVAATTTAATSATVLKILGAVALVGVASGALILAMRSEPPPADAPAVLPGDAWPAAPAEPAPPVAAAPADDTPSDEPPIDEASADEAPKAAASARQGPQPARIPAGASAQKDELAQEVAILSRASSALHGGRPAEALNILDEHQRRFPRGMLAQERTAARIQALCALGRKPEARAALAGLSPDSPLEVRARKACGFAPMKKK